LGSAVAPAALTRTTSKAQAIHDPTIELDTESDVTLRGIRSHDIRSHDMADFLLTAMPLIPA
jgi:hypothetical protein